MFVIAVSPPTGSIHYATSQALRHDPFCCLGYLSTPLNPYDGPNPQSNCLLTNLNANLIPFRFCSNQTNPSNADSIRIIQLHYSGTLFGFRLRIRGTDLTFVLPAALTAATQSALPRHLIIPYFRIPLGVLALRNVISSSIPQSSSAISEKPSSSSGLMFLPPNPTSVVSITSSSLPALLGGGLERYGLDMDLWRRHCELVTIMSSTKALISRIWSLEVCI